MSTSVLIVERPGRFRDSLLHEVSQRGATAHVRDDAMEALASIERLTPEIILISDDPGPPGALGLCRMLRRKLSAAAVFRIGEPSAADQLDERSVVLPRALGPSALAAAILDRNADTPQSAGHRAWEGTVPSLELGALMLAIETRWLTGRLLISRPGTEREIAFVRGLPVHARSSVLAERLGVLGLRRGFLRESQIEEALDLAHARGLRLGAALLELRALDATQLFTLLSAQLLEQLTAACNSGECRARFVLDPSVTARYPLLRASPLTALLHAAAASPLEDVEHVLDELAEHALLVELTRPAEQWLRALQLPNVNQLSSEVDSVRALRARIRSVTWSRRGEPALHPDVLTLALLRSGMFRMPGMPGPRPLDARAGIRSLSPPSIVSAIVRCSQSDFSRWPVSALARARTPLEQATDEYLHGERPATQARELALRGPEADADPRHSEVYEFTLCTNPLQPLAATGDRVRPPTLSELRLRYHALLKRLDTLEAEYAAMPARVHLLQMRVQVERALGMLPAPEQTPAARAVSLASSTEVIDSIVAEVLEPVPILQSRRPVSLAPAPAESAAPVPSLKPQVASARPASATPPAANTTAPDAALLAAAEPLLQQGRWRDLQQLLAAPASDPASSPVFALLYAIALKEDATRPVDVQNRPTVQAERLGITAMGRLLGVAEDSAATVLIAKRLLRKRQLDWRQKPRTGMSIALALGAMSVGALVGFLLHSQLLGLLWR